MHLSVGERLVLLQILPREGNFITLKIVRELRESLSFADDELQALDFKYEGAEFVRDDGTVGIVPPGQVRWNPNAEASDIEFSKTGADIIAKKLKELDKQEKLTEELFELYEKFVENGAC